MRKALFLDRDGVINVDRGYVSKVEDFEWVPGSADLCVKARELGYLLIIVTNQSGIGRGLYSEADYQTLTEWYRTELEKKGVTLDAIYHCPYHESEGIGDYRQLSDDRKPRPGMLLKAKERFDIDMASSIMIGDKLTDMQAGQAAGVGTLIYFGGASAPDIAHHHCHSHEETRALL